MSNHPHPAVRVVTRFDGRGYYVELPEPSDPQVRKVVDLNARRKQLEQELQELEEEMKRLQAELDEANDTNVVEDFLQGIGVQDNPVDDIQAALARVPRE